MFTTIKKLFFVVLLLTHFLSFSQTITTTAETITSCPGTVTIPINVTNFNDVASISLTMEFSGQMMNYIGYINDHPQLSIGTLLINGTSDKVLISWFSLTPLNIGSDKLLELEFDYIKDNSVLSWDTNTAGSCQYSDSNLNDMPALFIDGGVISSLTEPNLIAPQHQSLSVPISSTFKWSNSYCTPSYRIQVSKDSVFSDIVVAATGISDTFYFVSNLEYSTTYFWRVKASIPLQSSSWSDTARFTTKDPNSIFEYNNTNSILNLSISPNPVEYQAYISFELPEPGDVSLSFYDLSGRLIHKRSKGIKLNKGTQTILKDVSELPAGIYLCEIKVLCAEQTFVQRKKVVVLKK